MTEPCTNCPPPVDTGWKNCKNPECKAHYKDYEGLYHSSLCPKCSHARQVAEQFERAAEGRFAGMRTNAPRST
jgi:hypothetical protein